MFSGIAYAMGGAGGGAAAQGQSASWGPLVPIALMFVIFYFLLIRPQQKQQKKLQQMIASLRKGDRVITSGGIYGRIVKLDENVVTLEVADKVQIKVLRNNIASMAQSGPSSGPGG